MSLLTPDPGLLFWMLLSFGIVVFVLCKFGFPVIVRMVHKREDYIDRSLAAAKEAQARLANIRQESEQMLQHTRAEQARLLDETRHLCDDLKAQAREAAEAEAAKLRAEAQQAIRQEKEQALRELRAQVADLSVRMAERVLREELKDKEGQLHLIDRLLDDVQTN